MEFCNACFEGLPADFDARFCPHCGQGVSGEKAPPKRKARKARKAPARKAPKPPARPTVPSKPDPAPAPSAPASEWALAAVLLAAAVAIRLQGRYRKTSESNSTKAYLADLIWSGETDNLATDKDRETAKASEVWLDGLDGVNDYEYSLLQAVRRARRDGEVHDHDLGRIASAVASAQRAAKRKASRESKSPAIFAGVEGARGRQDLGTVEVATVRYMAAYDNWLVKGSLVEGPATGADVSWFTQDEIEPGLKAQLRAKVKRHSKRFGETQVSYVQLELLGSDDAGSGDVPF